MEFKHLCNDKHILKMYPRPICGATAKMSHTKHICLYMNFSVLHICIPFPVLLRGEIFMFYGIIVPKFWEILKFSLFLSILCKLTNNIAAKLGWSSACRDLDKEWNELHWISLFWIGKFQVFLIQSSYLLSFATQNSFYYHFRNKMTHQNYLKWKSKTKTALLHF